MAMELMKVDRFYDQLRKAGLSPTEHNHKHGEVWQLNDGRCITVPHVNEPVPDWVLDKILGKLGLLYQDQ